MLDPFYPVVDASGWVARLVPAGVGSMQLRIKDQPQAEVRRAECAPALSAPPARRAAHRQRLLAGGDRRGLRYVHLGQEDLVDADVKALRRAGIRSASARTITPNSRRRCAIDPDYVALGPIYPTKLKRCRGRRRGPSASRMEEADRREAAGRDRRPHAGARARRSMPRGPIASPWSATSPRTSNPDARVRAWLGQAEAGGLTLEFQAGERSHEQARHRRRPRHPQGHHRPARRPRARSIARPEAAPELRVPVREIALDASSGEPPLPVYDTTGAYTDPDVAIDVEKGLPAPASNG